MKKHSRMLNSLKRKKERIRYVLFDYDGVIVDSLPLIHKVYKKLSGIYKFDYSYKSSKDVHETSWRTFLRRLGLKDHATMEALEKDFHRLQKEMEEGVALCKGMEKTIRYLHRKGYVLAICSGNYKDVIEKKLKKHGLRKYFSKVLDFNDAERKSKPDPTLLNKAIKELNAKPENCIYIGDMDGDIQASRNANLYKVIAVTWGLHSHKRLTGADAIVDTPKSLITAIERFD